MLSEQFGKVFDIRMPTKCKHAGQAVFPEQPRARSCRAEACKVLLLLQAQPQQTKITVHTDAAHVTTRHAFKSVWLVLANHCVTVHVCYHHCNIQNGRILLQLWS